MKQKVTRRRKIKGEHTRGKRKKREKKSGTRERYKLEKLEEKRLGSQKRGKVRETKMATNKGRPRIMGKAGDKADFKNTLDKYSLSE